ncbi:MAG: SCP2 sterol-binding domain-containing protein [Anaerolineae bacterium]|nr:SCP2 sterol-binding domain-containing protein [Anaerolineae bacterium]
MPYKFPSDEWIKALMVELNKSEAYHKSAKTWEGDFYFIATPGDSLTEPVIMYMDLWHGDCRAAGVVADESEKAPEFRISASLAVWRKVIEKKLDPIQGLMTGQLKLKGNMVKIMKAPKAAAELVNCCTLVPTDFT